MSSFTPATTTGGSFVCTAGSYAIARSAITVTPDVEVSFRFDIARRPLWLRIGSTAGGQELLSDVIYEPGEHLLSFASSVGTLYFEFQLREVGNATLSNFARVAPGIMSLPTPWLEADLPNLRSEQSLDVQWWVCPRIAPRTIERRGENSWSCRKFQPRDGPFENDNDTDITLTPSARTGTVTITSSQPTFKTVDAGSLIRLTQVGQYETANAFAVGAATASIKVTGIGASARSVFFLISGTFVATIEVQRSVDGEASWQTIRTITAPLGDGTVDDLDNQIAYYRLAMTARTSGSATLEIFYSGGVTDGVARIHTVDADNRVTVDVLRPFAATTATVIWGRGSWSDRFGWPTALALHDGRLAMFRDSRRWQSAPDDYESFAVGAEDADAISGTLPGPMNAARWAKSTDRLLIGTAGAEGEIGSGALDDVVTPSNARARMRTQRGGFNADACVIESGSTAFIHRSGRKLLGILANQDGFRTLDLTRLHKTAHGGGFVEMDWQTEPEPRLWVVRADGQVLHILISEDEQLFGIARYRCEGGEIESVCVLPATPEDAIYFAVKRTINGSEVRHLEKMAVERWWDGGVSSDSVRLQDAVIYSGASATVLSGLDHLEGEDVYVWGNGRISGPYTVVSGEITLTYAVTYAVIGIKYVGQYKSPRLIGNGLARFSNVQRIGMLIHNTVRGAIGWGRSIDKITNYLKDRTPDGTYDSPTEVVTEDVSFPLDGSWDRDHRVCIEFSGVAPASVLALSVNRLKP